MSDARIDEALARRLTRALAEDFLIDDWVSMTGRAAHGVGRSVRTSQPIVVDVLLSETPQAERDTFHRSSQKAASLADKLTHPGIVTVYGAGMIGEWPYAASLPTDGVRLDEILQSGPALDAKACARIIGDIAQSLAHAHGEGITHGRVAANHVVVDRTSRAAILADFGADGGSVSGDISQLARLGAQIAGKTQAPTWLTEVIEKASRGAGGYAAARELADDLAKRVPGQTRNEAAAPTGRALTLEPNYILTRAATLQAQTVGGSPSGAKALQAFTAAGVPASLESLDEAAFEADIERRFVMLAAAENSTHRTGTSLTVSRIVDASVPEVLRGVSRLSQPQVGLALRDTIGGRAEDGGVMIYQIPHGHPLWKSTADALGATMLLLSVTRASNGRDPRASDVVMSVAIDPQRTRGGGSNTIVGAGVGGAVLGGIAGAITGGMIAAVIGAAVAAGAGGWAGAALKKSGSETTLASAKREISAAIDVLSS